MGNYLFSQKLSVDDRIESLSFGCRWLATKGLALVVDHLQMQLFRVKLYLYKRILSRFAQLKI